MSGEEGGGSAARKKRPVRFEHRIRLEGIPARNLFDSRRAAVVANFRSLTRSQNDRS